MYFFAEPETNVERTIFPSYESSTEGGQLVEAGNFNYAQTAGRILFISDIIGEEPIYQGPSTGGGGTYGGTIGTAGVNYNPTMIRMHKMKIKVDKQDWIAGASEVNMVGFRTFDTPSSSGFCGEFLQGATNCYNPDGQQIDKIENRWINNLHEYDYIFHNFNISGSVIDPIMNYVIFEQDTWPANIREHVFTFPNGSSRNIYYRSWQLPFHDQQLSKNNTSSFPFAGNYIGDNSDIYYIMQGS